MGLKQHRADLFKQDPHCFWCGQLTTEQVNPMLSNSATIEHLYSVRHPFRKKKNRQKAGFQRGALLYVLACWKCNNERGNKEKEGKVFVPVLEQRREVAIRVSVNSVEAIEASMSFLSYKLNQVIS